MTLAGVGRPGVLDGVFEHAQFSEPGGLCLHPEGKVLVVADTNNHLIRILDLDSAQTRKVSHNVWRG